jgi:GDSL-like lipase/acylhydrolase family protein/SGNH-like hydrolase/esterase family protein
MEYSIEELKPYIFGLPWFGKENTRFYRFPSSSFDKLSEEMQRLAKHSAGAMIRFKAKTEIIALEITIGIEGSMGGFSRIGQYGLDFYCDGQYWISFETKDGHQNLWIETDGSKFHEYIIYLPIYSPIEIHTLAVESHLDEEETDTQIFPPMKFQSAQKIVVYGSSITQGAFASRPAMTYPSQLGRLLDIEMINLGFAGNGKGEPEVADLLSEISDVGLFLLDWGCNLCDPAEVNLIVPRYPEMVQKLRKAYPNVPILYVNSQSFINETKDPIVEKNFNLIRKVTEENYILDKDEGNNCDYIDGQQFLGQNDMDLTVDGCHCNDWGFHSYADNLIPLIKKLMNIS